MAKAYVDSVFDQQSTTVADNEEPDQSKKIVTIGNAILAYEMIFQSWGVDLTLEQQHIVRYQFFPTAWKKNENKDEQLEIADAFKFLGDMMQHQPTIDNRAQIQNTGSLVQKPFSVDSNSKENSDIF